MSILQAMNTGVSGITAESEALSVVGDNISNVNTVGFKSQRAIFEDMLGRAITAGTSTPLPGAGVKFAGMQQIFSQGSLSATGIATDLALSGEGFFVVRGTVEGVDDNFYTRAGQFKVNNAGYLVTYSGLRAQGYSVLEDGTMSAAVGDIQIPTNGLPPNPTSEMSVSVNLDSGASAPLNAWDATNPSLTSNFSTSLTVYDSLGESHNLDVYFRKSGTNTWDYSVIAQGDEMAGGTAGNVEVGTGSFTFTTDGALDTHSVTQAMSLNFAGAAPNQAITVDFGTPIAAGGTGREGVTQYRTPFTVSGQSQDGYASGDLAGVTVDGQGIVRGIYSNGQKLALGQMAVAKFRANEGLGRAGHNLWFETRDSGPAAVGTAGAGGRASVSSGMLEQSNVDLAQQMVELISHERAFQANSKTITTADSLLQELVNIKR